MPNFHESAEDIRIDNGHILRCRLRKADGDYVNAELDLNGCIGNNDGRFEWGGSNFSHSADRIRFDIEGEYRVPVLRAYMRTPNGEEFEADVNLAERIDNNDGTLKFY